MVSLGLPNPPTGNPRTRRRPETGPAFTSMAKSEYRTNCKVCKLGIFTADKAVWVRGKVTGLVHDGECAGQANGTVVGRERTKPAAAKPAPPLPVGTGQKLSPRQLELVTLIAGGRSVQGIADDSDVGVFTVYKQLRDARKRLGAVDNYALVAIARRAGLIEGVR